MPVLRIAGLSAALLFASSPSAFAYIDPVTGSFLLQGAVGAAAAILAGFRSVRLKVVSLFTGKTQATKPGIE
ncbi:MAG: hypothetical protein U1F47_02045 [Hyphomicrobiales bacterium]|jgi:hypothetical protein